MEPTCPHCGEPVVQKVGPTSGYYAVVLIAPRLVHMDGSPDCKKGL